MKNKITRRNFVGKIGVASVAINSGVFGSIGMDSSQSKTRKKITDFDYCRVSFGSNRWQKQYELAREFYNGIPNDDILYGFRKAVGLPAPGKSLGGWCAVTSNTVFGQWLSGMARMSYSSSDFALRNKAINLMNEWAKTVSPNGDCRMLHYPIEKVVGGLVDMKKYADQEDAISLMNKISDWAILNLNRDRIPAAPNPRNLNSGRPGEWYTLSENYYRAYEITGDEKYKTFAEVWHYPQFWEKFAETSNPDNVYGIHAYSHVNTFSSAAMAYQITGEPRYLNMMINFYDFMQNTQCYATGGYGPSESLMPANGSLGKSLDYRTNTFETICGSWAGFKLSRYLMEFTGEARYGDWIERLLYNGVGAALPITSGGKNFYYSDYRLTSGMKFYDWMPDHAFTCCSGTYIQNMAEYLNLIYFKDANSLFVNLYIPSEVVWNYSGNEVRIQQETSFPETDISYFKLTLPQSLRFAIKFRIPLWTRRASLKVNGVPVNVECRSGEWASVEQNWQSGDKIEIQLPMHFRYSPIDRQNPNRVAIVRGPLAIAMYSNNHVSIPKLPDSEEELNQLMVSTDQPGVFRLKEKKGNVLPSNFYPFYMVSEGQPYCIYFDMDKLPIPMWYD